MIKINLKRYYPHYTSDVYIEVPDDIAIVLHAFENEEAAFRMLRSRNRAFYSLDREDGLEREMQYSTPSIEDGFFREHLACSLFSALKVIISRTCYSTTTNRRDMFGDTILPFFDHFNKESRLYR